eukprot:c7737_g1_i1.p1 GENE.c7737_g1_i1~~c7737_g1_i1.p1  ORF type:complete len:278 (-),score=60.86 c7737_g1_i1:525-1358(-)
MHTGQNELIVSFWSVIFPHPQCSAFPNPFRETLGCFHHQLTQKYANHFSLSLRIHSVDDPEKHGGRARIFPHIEGNYATHVFIPLDPSPALEAGIRDVLGHVGAHHGELVRILPPDPIHISLTRTFALRKHQIDPFVRLVRDAVALIPVFSSELSTAKYFHNDSNTRSFVSLCVCRTISNHDNSIYNITNANTNDNAKHYSLLVELIHRLDGALSRFEKPAFYEDPIPHASVAWAVGVAPENIRDLSLTLANPVPFHIDHVVVKCGAKEYSCPLRMQ